MEIPLGTAGTDSDATELLPQLLAEGWLPIRETSFGNGSILIVLERN